MRRFQRPRAGLLISGSGPDLKNELSGSQCSRAGSSRAVAPVDLIIGDDERLVALSPTVARVRIAVAQAKLARVAGLIATLASGQSAAEVLASRRRSGSERCPRGAGGPSSWLTATT